MNSADAAPQAWVLTALAGFAAVLWFATLGLRPLFNPDEGRYAEIPREMLADGDWVIPHLNGVAYIEKPPLQYWATALSLKLWGATEFAARFYTALCAMASIAATGFAARRWWGPAAGWRAGAVLGSMPLFVVLGQLLTLDMSLTAFMTLSLAGFLLAQRAPQAWESRRWMLLAWSAAALGVLTKGLVAAAIPALVLLLYSLVGRDWAPWRRLHLGMGLPLFLAISVPWHALAAIREPRFLSFFFVHEHFSRYLTPSADREEAWWYFGAVFVLGTLPWTLSALRVLATDWKRGIPGKFDARLFLKIWVLFVLLFFSLSDSKLIPYILPALPAVALLVADSASRCLRREVLVTAGITVLVALGLALGAWRAPAWLAASDRRDYFLPLARPLLEIAALLAVTGAWVLAERRRDLTRSVAFLGVGWCVAGLLLMRAAALAAPLYSGATLVRALPSLPRDIPVFSVATYDQTLPFYWRRTVRLVEYRGELDFGLRRDPGAELPDLAAFIDRWRGTPQAYAVMENSLFDELAARDVPMRKLAADAHRSLVARR